MACIANATTEPEEHEEIEITPEMVEAGAREFLACRALLTETPEDAAEAIFTAMVLAQRESSAPVA